MTTTLAIHDAQMPTVEFTDFGWFTSLDVVVADKNGNTTRITMYLPEGTTTWQVINALGSVKVLKKNDAGNLVEA